MAGNPTKAAVKKVRVLLDALGPALTFRKMHGVLNALEMQVEDGEFAHHAVTRLCEALLATAELYEIPEKAAARLEEVVCAVVTVVEERR